MKSLLANCKKMLQIFWCDTVIVLKSFKWMSLGGDTVLSIYDFSNVIGAKQCTFPRVTIEISTFSLVPVTCWLLLIIVVSPVVLIFIV